MNCCSFVGFCPSCRKQSDYLNIRHDHWLYCDQCRIKEYLGKDLFPSWRAETEAMWRDNAEKIKEYAEISRKTTLP